ncbi:Uncharacterised protein [Salmonella enterica subsp. enterica]|nr:Uncharacterised protein [Salmonella enterica subsp. enterica serovar Typhi]VFS83814.1 Uncharacterised protein [Salmonella enterica subsp. enterica]
MLTATFYPHAEGFAFKLFAILRQRFLENVVHIGERHIFDFKNMVNPRDAGQRVANRQTLVFIFGANFNVIPVTDNREGLIVVL